MPNARHTCFVLSFRYLQDTISRINVKSRLFLLFHTGGTKHTDRAFCRAMLRHHTTWWVSAMQWDSMSYKTVYLIQTILFCNRLTDNTLQAPTIISRLTTPENKRWDRLKVLVGPIL